MANQRCWFAIWAQVLDELQASGKAEVVGAARRPKQPPMGWREEVRANRHPLLALVRSAAELSAPSGQILPHHGKAQLGSDGVFRGD